MKFFQNNLKKFEEKYYYKKRLKDQFNNPTFEAIVTSLFDENGSMRKIREPRIDTSFRILLE